MSKEIKSGLRKSATMSTIPFDVYLNGTIIDTVYCSSIDDEESVRRSLINHDGYDEQIEVVKVSNRIAATKK